MSESIKARDARENGTIHIVGGDVGAIAALHSSCVSLVGSLPECSGPPADFGPVVPDPYVVEYHRLTPVPDPIIFVEERRGPFYASAKYHKRGKRRK